jgi:hypothetical protein
MANVLLDVVDTFDSLDQQYNLLRIACRTQSDVDALEAKYATAQENVEVCTNQLLEDDTAEIAALDKQLKDCNVELRKAVAKMGNMSKVLDNLTQAITLGAQLIAKIP